MIRLCIPIGKFFASGRARQVVESKANFAAASDGDLSRYATLHSVVLSAFLILGVSGLMSQTNEQFSSWKTLILRAALPS